MLRTMSVNKGEILDNRYQMSEKLGEGNMGEIYRAFDLLKDRKEVAVKLIKTPIIDKGQRDILHNFRQEFDIMRRLKHPGLIKVYDLGELSAGEEVSNLYFTMEYIKGINLKQFLKEKGNIEKDAGINIMVMLLRTLSFIHSRNIIYRDLKQENIMIISNGNNSRNIKILDFGLSDTERIKNQSKTKGTIKYMAPETFQNYIDHRVDIFASGILFFELITGEAFWEGDDSLNIIHDLTNTWRYNKTKNKNLLKIKDKILRKIINKMISYDKSHRYFNCSGIINDINNLLHHKYELETPETSIAYVLGIDLAGREYEMRFLEEKLSGNDSKLNIVLGGIGTGKSRLMEEFKGKCQLNGLFYIENRCNENQKPYEIFANILKELILRSKEDLIIKYGKILKRILPDHDKLKNDKINNIISPDLEKDSLIKGIIDYIIDFSNDFHKKIIIFIDDFYLIDENSFNTICELLYRVQGDKKGDLIKLYANSRDNEPGIILLLDEMQKKNIINTLELKAFSLDNTKRFIETIFGKKEISPQLLSYSELFHKITGGNPYILQEFIKELIHKGNIVKNVKGWFFNGNLKSMKPIESIQEIVKENIRKLNLSRREYKTLKIIALLNHSISIENLKYIMKNISPELNEINYQAFLNNLLEYEILVLEGENYALANNLIKTILIEDLEISEKSILHYSIAESFLNIFNKEKNEIFIDKTAYHYSLSYMIDKTLFKKEIIHYLKLAGDLHNRESALKRALYYYDKILFFLNKYNCDDMEMEIQILHNTGKIQSILGEWQKSLLQFEKALDISIRSGSETNIINSEKFLADQLRLMNRYDESYSYFSKCLSYYEKNNMEHEKAEILMKIGLLYYNKDLFDQSIKFLQRALIQSERRKYMDLLPRILNGLGLINLAQNNLDNAKEFFERSLQAAKSYNKDKHLILAGFNNLGIVSRKLGNYDKAIRYYSKLIEIASDLPYKQMLGTALGNMGAIYAQIGDYIKAVDYMQKAVNIYRELGYYKNLSIFKSNIGKCHMDMKDYSKGEESFLEAISIARELDNDYILCSYYYSLSELFFQKGDYEKAKLNNERSLSLSMKSCRKDTIIFSKIMKEKLRALENKDMAIEKLEALYLEAEDELLKADIAYEIFLLCERKSTKSEKYKDIALSILERQYKIIPRMRDKIRIKELRSTVSSHTGNIKIRRLLDKAGFFE